MQNFCLPLGPVNNEPTDKSIHNVTANNKVWPEITRPNLEIPDPSSLLLKS